MVLASVKASEGVGWPAALPLLPHPAEIIIGLIAFAILYRIFSKSVVPKMEAMYAERAAAIEGGMQEAERASRAKKAEPEAAEAVEAAPKPAKGRSRSKATPAATPVRDATAIAPQSAGLFVARNGDGGPR